MIYRHFRIQCVLRVLLISASILGAVILAVNYSAYFAAVVVGLLALYQVARLIHYVEKTNFDLARMLSAIRYADYSQNFSSGRRGKSFEDLSAAFRSVMNDFRKTRSEKETHYRYLHTIMQHVGVGLISFKQDGSVNLINNAAKRLLRVSHLKNIETLHSFSPILVDILKTLKYGDKKLVKIVDDDELLQLIIHSTEFKLGEDLYTLASIQDIQSELDEKEVEAWQKLTSVLTHEIMNSVAPISSLAGTASNLLEESYAGVPAAEVVTGDTIADVRGAVKTIARRSESLLHFVDDYRKLTRVPRPNFNIVSVNTLFNDVHELLDRRMTDAGITFSKNIVPPDLEIAADSELVEQVLINLVSNSIQALAETVDPSIILDACIDRRGRATIKVIDNGRGIVKEAIDKIFIPFFTTRKEGSGIGLSLSREIMRQHGGSIGASSIPGERTVFTLRF